MRATVGPRCAERGGGGGQEIVLLVCSKVCQAKRQSWIRKDTKWVSEDYREGKEGEGSVGEGRGGIRWRHLQFVNGIIALQGARSRLPPLRLGLIGLIR